MGTGQYWIILLDDRYWYRGRRVSHRIEVFELLAVLQGVYGRGVALDAFFNRFVNEVGSRNSNKPERELHASESEPHCRVDMNILPVLLPPVQMLHLQVSLFSTIIHTPLPILQSSMISCQCATSRMRWRRTDGSARGRRNLSLKYEPGRKYAMRDPRKGKASGYLSPWRLMLGREDLLGKTSWFQFMTLVLFLK